MQQGVVLLVVVCTLVCVAAVNATVVNGLGDPVRNARPIVGVMAQPTYADPQYKGLGRTYLAAAYVKWFVPPQLFPSFSSSFSLSDIAFIFCCALTMAGSRVRALAWSLCSTDPPPHPHFDSSPRSSACLMCGR